MSKGFGVPQLWGPMFKGVWGPPAMGRHVQRGLGSSSYGAPCPRRFTHDDHDATRALESLGNGGTGVERSGTPLGSVEGAHPHRDPVSAHGRRWLVRPR